MKRLTLPDTRQLAYAEYGSAEGLPVFFFHGIPGSRMFRPYDDVTLKKRIRLICVDRPGYGGSSYQPKRRILDWPSDISHLADHLGLNKFCVMGHSGGGPYTLACAFALPERVIHASILSGAGPFDLPHATNGMPSPNKAGFKIGRYIPWPVWRLLNWYFFRLRRADPASAIDNESTKRLQADDALLNKPEIRHVCIQSEVEGFRQGLLGIAWDTHLITRPWGFRLERIQVPVKLWYGTADNLTPITMGREMATRIPNAELLAFNNEGHLLLFSHWDRILTSLQ